MAYARTSELEDRLGAQKALDVLSADYGVSAAVANVRQILRAFADPRFPYVIAFERHQHHVLVLAIAHAKRRPLYWFTRTNP